MAKDDFLEATMGSMDMVHNLARRLMRDEHDAEDLVQDTYLNAFRAWGTRRRPRNVDAWLGTICLNLARSRFRTRKRRPEEVFDPEAGVGVVADGNTESDAMAGVDAGIVHRAMWDLPEEQRIAISLVDLSGLTTTEAATVMGTPRGTVLSRVHRGRKALATLVKKEVEVREP